MATFLNNSNQTIQIVLNNGSSQIVQVGQEIKFFDDNYVASITNTGNPSLMTIGAFSEAEDAIFDYQGFNGIYRYTLDNIATAITIINDIDNPVTMTNTSASATIPGNATVVLLVPKEQSLFFTFQASGLPKTAVTINPSHPVTIQAIEQKIVIENSSKGNEGLVLILTLLLILLLLIIIMLCIVFFGPSSKVVSR